MATTGLTTVVYKRHPQVKIETFPIYPKTEQPRWHAAKWTAALRQLSCTPTIKQQLNWSICLSAPTSMIAYFHVKWPPATSVSHSPIQRSGSGPLQEVAFKYPWEEDETGDIWVCLVMFVQFFTWLNQDWRFKPSSRLKTAGVVLWFYFTRHLQHLSGSLGFAGLFVTNVEMISSVMCDKLALPYHIFIL